MHQYDYRRKGKHSGNGFLKTSSVGLDGDFGYTPETGNCSSDSSNPSSGGSPSGSLSEDGLTQGDNVERPGPIADDLVNLKRRVGLLSGVALIVGTMIGSGIFVSPADLLDRTGSVALSLIIWAACGVLAMLGSLAYAELGTMNASSGGEYAYFLEAFGSLPAFLFSWVSTLVLKPSQLAIVALSFSKYAVEAFVWTECGTPELLEQVVAALTILIILFINCHSVNLATGVQNVFTVAKLVAIVIIVGGGMYYLVQGNTVYLSKGFEDTNTSFGEIATAFYTGLWAYDGWNTLNYVTEEMTDPYLNLPRSILIGLPLVTVCYVLINISYLTVMSPREMIASEAVAMTFGNRVLGMMAWLMPLSVTISTFGSANGTLFTAGRLCFAASREGHLMDVLSYVHIKRYTPCPALIFHSIIAMVMVFCGNIASLIDFFSFTAWIFYGGSMLALLVLRRKKKYDARPYRVPAIIPITVLVFSVYLVIGPIIDQPKIEYLYATMFIMTGMLVYIPFVHCHWTLPGMDRITVYTQLLLRVSPPQSAIGVPL